MKTTEALHPYHTVTRGEWRDANHPREPCRRVAQRDNDLTISSDYLRCSTFAELPVEDRVGLEPTTSGLSLEVNPTSCPLSRYIHLTHAPAFFRRNQKKI
jgi:hypothetical protein